MEKLIQIPVGEISLEGMLEIPEGAAGLVIFAHGAGSSRHSPRNNYVAGVLREAGLATLLFDLLTEKEDETYQTRFNIELLSERLVDVTRWLKGEAETKGLNFGYFGSSTGAAAALFAAAQLPNKIKTVVSRGGRPDLAEPILGKVKASTLLIVGGNDFQVIELNELAFSKLNCEKKLEIIPGATHLFEETATLEQVAELAAKWFKTKLS